MKTTRLSDEKVRELLNNAKSLRKYEERRNCGIDNIFINRLCVDIQQGTKKTEVCRCAVDYIIDMRFGDGEWNMNIIKGVTYLSLSGLKYIRVFEVVN